MKKYTNRKAKVLYLNLLICLTHISHELDVINFIPDSYYILVPIAFLSTFILWNGLLIYDNKN